MVDRPHKPATLSTPSALPPQPAVTLTHGSSRVSAVLPTGESVEVLLHGATIISWRSASGAEQLFLSSAASLDGSAPVRGGIPLVFPVFGPPKDTGKEEVMQLSQHGFVRTARWELLGKSTSEGEGMGEGDGSVKLDFGLSAGNLDEETRKKWPYAFGLIYSVTLAREGLTTSMVVRNEGQAAWEFQILMHTYLRVQDISQVQISGLESSTYTDKLTTPISTQESSSEPLSITSKVDRVYTPSGEHSNPIIVTEGGKKKFKIVRDNLSEVVVWNPWTEAAKDIKDFRPEDGWQQMICVEAGAVRGWQKLEAGETWEGGQVIEAAT